MDNKVNINVCGVQGAPYTYKTVVLKPNVVDGKNILTQLMMGQTNTKYVIKYDYVIDPDIQTGIASVSESNISHCVNPNYAAALAAYNLAHDAWIDADNAYTNNPNDTTLAAKNAAYAAYSAAQTTLNNTPQFYYYAANAILVKQGQHISIPKGCVLLNASLSGIMDFVVAPTDTTVYIGSLTAGDYNYTVQNAIVIPSGCLIEFDGGSISDGVLIGDETILIYDQQEEVVLKNVELLGDFEYSAGGSGGDIPDKEYDPEHFSGLGRKTLQLKGGSNILTQDDFDQENTIYVITYDFDLNGAEIQIPEGCVISFDGGNISNGRLISNHTYLKSVNKLNSDALYGVFYSEDGTSMNYNQNKEAQSRVIFEDGFMAPGEKLNFSYTTQAIAVTPLLNIESSPKKYIIIAGYVSGGDGVFVVFDENYNFKGSCKTKKGHFNDCTLYNGMLYIPCCGEGVNELKTIYIYNPETIVRTALKYKDIHYISIDTYEEVVTPTEKVMPRIVYGLDYDPVTDEFGSYCLAEDGSDDEYIYIYDSELNLKRKGTLSIDKAATSLLGKEIVHQSVVYKKGVLQMVGYQKGNGWFEIGPLVVYNYDIPTDTITNIKCVNSPYQNAEPEGAFKDVDDDNNFYCVYGLKSNASSSGVLVGKIINDNSYEDSSSVKGAEDSLWTRQQRFDVSIDNSYTGKSTGDTTKPFKSIESALMLITGSSVYTNLTVRYTGNDYILPSYLLRGGQAITISGVDASGASKKEVGIKINKTFEVLDSSTLRLNNLTLHIDGGKISVTCATLKMSNIDVYVFNQNSSVNAIDLSDAYCSMIPVRFISESREINGETVTNKAKAINLAENTYLYVWDTTFDSFDTAIYNRFSVIRNNQMHFINCNICISTDDSRIMLDDPHSLYKFDFVNCTTGIYKEVRFRGDNNVVVSPGTPEYFKATLATLRSCNFSNTSVAIKIRLSNFIVDGVLIPIGIYEWTDTTLRTINGDYRLTHGDDTMKIISLTSNNNLLMNSDSPLLLPDSTTIDSEGVWRQTSTNMDFNYLARLVDVTVPNESNIKKGFLLKKDEQAGNPLNNVCTRVYGITPDAYSISMFVKGNCRFEIQFGYADSTQTELLFKKECAVNSEDFTLMTIPVSLNESNIRQADNSAIFYISVISGEGIFCGIKISKGIIGSTWSKNKKEIEDNISNKINDLWAAINTVKNIAQTDVALTNTTQIQAKFIAGGTISCKDGISILSRDGSIDLNNINDYTFQSDFDGFITPSVANSIVKYPVFFIRNIVDFDITGSNSNPISTSVDKLKWAYNISLNKTNSNVTGRADLREFVNLETCFMRGTFTMDISNAELQNLQVLRIYSPNVFGNVENIVCPNLTNLYTVDGTVGTNQLTGDLYITAVRMYNAGRRSGKLQLHITSASLGSSGLRWKGQTLYEASGSYNPSIIFSDNGVTINNDSN